MTIDQRLMKTMRRFVDDSLAYVNADPIDLADYLYDLYRQHDRLDILALIARQLIWREYNHEGLD